MADGPEDDITIIDGDLAESPEEGAQPVFNFYVPPPSTSAPQLSSDIHPASHHALSFAYSDLKKRYNELEGKNKVLVKNLQKAKKTLRDSTELDTTMNGDIRFEDQFIPRPGPQFGGALTARDNQTDSCEDGETNLMSDVEATSLLRVELAKEQKTKADVKIKYLELQKEMSLYKSSVEAELNKRNEKIRELQNENGEMKEDNTNVKRRLRETQSTVKKLEEAKFQLEKQLMQNEEYQDLIISQMDRMRVPGEGSVSSQSPSTTTSEQSTESDTAALNADIEKAVSIIKRQIKEMASLREVIISQRKQLHAVVRKVKGNGNESSGYGARPKQKVPSEHASGPDVTASTVVQCEEDLLTMQPDSPNQTMLVAGRSTESSRGSTPHSIGNPFDFSVPAHMSPPSQQTQMLPPRPTSSSAPSSAHQNILRKKAAPFNPPDLITTNSPNHSSGFTGYSAASTRPRESRRSQSAIIPGGDIFENNEDIYNESLPQMPPGIGSIGRSATAPAGYRHSTGQIMFGNTPAPGILPPGTGAGADPLPSPQEWAAQALAGVSRPEPIGSSSTMLENRHRPQARTSQPRPLNIDRNVDEDGPPRAQQNESANVNLFPGESRDKHQTPGFRKPELLNNDPLVTGAKPIPSRNIYTEDLLRDNPIERTDLAEDTSLCPVCNHEYPIETIEEHVSECLPDVTPAPNTGAQQTPRVSETERVCPMCSETFDNIIPQSDFEEHVNRHFGDDALGNFEVLNHP